VCIIAIKQFKFEKNSWKTCVGPRRILAPTVIVQNGIWQDIFKTLMFEFYRVIKQSLCTWRLQSPHNWWFEDGHHRIHSECGPCYTEHGLQERSLACQ